MTLRPTTATWLAIAALAVLLAACTPEPEQEKTPPEQPTPTPPPVTTAEHFLCYRAFEPPGPGTNVKASFRDQFDDDFEPVNGFPRFFCNPVDKQHADGDPGPQPGEDEQPALLHPDHHLTGYGWADPQEDEELEPQWGVTVSNQFGAEVELELAQERWFMVPSGKNGSAIPRDLDHYKCYPVIGGPAVLQPVHLDDQFPGRYDYIEVGPAKAFCNPAEKQIPEPVEIQHPEDHLTCYQVEDYPVTQNVTIDNQLAQGTHLSLNGLKWLCAPSTKVDFHPVTPPKEEQGD